MSNSKLQSLLTVGKRRAWLVGLGVPLLLAIIWLCLPTRQRVARGLFMGDVALGGLRWEEAQRALSDSIEQRKHRTLAFGGETGICQANLENLGGKFEAARTLEAVRRAAANRYGMRGWFRQRTSLRPSLSFDAASLESWLGTCEKRVIRERPVEGHLIAKESDFVVRSSRAGRVIDRERFTALVEEALTRSDDAALPLPLRDQPELPSKAELERARDVAVELTSKAVILRAEKSKLTLLRADLAKMLEWHTEPGGAFAWRLSRPTFEQWLGSRRHRVEQRARDATYEVEGRDRLVVVPEQAGDRIAVEQLFAALALGLREGRRQLDIPFEPTELPKRVVADLDKLNIREPVGAFTTKHACCQPRVTNIHRIADLIDGTIILPGETYSVNEHIGQRSLENGFVPAPGIEDGEMVDTVGGGVSQFATTFYNAVMRAGYEVLERQAHTYWFDRYPMGHEATLSWPKPDIVLRNDTQAGLLILTSYTDRTITVRLFGDREGRRVDVSVSPRFDIVRPTVEYLPNPELEPDHERTKEGGCIGWSVWTMRTVHLRDGTSKADKRKVIYKPRIRRVEVHPCRIPKGEPGHTGEKCPAVTTDGPADDVLPEARP